MLKQLKIEDKARDLRNILSGRKRRSMRNKGVKKLKNFIQQMKQGSSIETLIVYKRSSNLIVYYTRIKEEIP
jgi:hypothetical protein